MVGEAAVVSVHRSFLTATSAAVRAKDPSQTEGHANQERVDRRPFESHDVKLLAIAVKAVDLPLLGSLACRRWFGIVRILYVFAEVRVIRKHLILCGYCLIGFD